MTTALLKKFLIRCVAFLIAFTAAFILFAGFTVVFGIWNEPTAPPPNSSVGAPITSSLETYQKKTGNLRVNDLFLDDVNRWMTDTQQFLPIVPVNLDTISTFSESNPNQAFLDWTTLSIDPVGVPAGAVVTGLALNVLCGEAFVWVTPEISAPANPPVNPSLTSGNIPFNQLLPNSPNTYTWRLACASLDNDADSQTVLVPVSAANQPIPGGLITIKYRTYATDPDTVGIRIDLAGVYYRY